MLRKWIQNRAAAKLYELASAGVRHGMGIAGAWLMGQDVATGGEVDVLTQGALIVVSIAWSFGRKLIDRPRLGAGLEKLGG